MNRRAIALLSGGLDSTLAAKVMIDQEIELFALNLTSPFCLCTPKDSCKSLSKRVSEELKIPLKVIYAGDEYLEIVRNPKFGYGKNMNPCIDCRIFMNKKARNYMDEVDASFIVTGEVLGQRPMSQRRDAMNIIERESGLKGLILRPLSAKLLKVTKPEEEGVVERERLLNISGRSRKPQLNMSKVYNLSEYLCGGAGCLLTDPGFSRRLKDHLSNNDKLNIRDINKLKVGRHYRFSSGGKLIVGRDERENNRLQSIHQDGDLFIKVVDYEGPISLYSGKSFDEDLELITGITLRYSDAPKNTVQKVRIFENSEDDGKIVIGNSEVFESYNALNYLI